MKSIVFIALGFLLMTSCSSIEVDDPMYTSLPVKDVPFQARKQDEPLRRKVLMMPILSHQVDSVTLMNVEKYYLQKLNELGKYTVVTTDQLQIPPQKYLSQDAKYEVSRIAKHPAVKAENISSLLIIIVEDIKYSRIGDKLGVFRQIKNQLDAKVRVAVVSTITEQAIFKSLKEATIIQTLQKTAERPYLDQKTFADPEMSEMAIKDALDEVVPNINENIVVEKWQGRIAEIQGERIYLNVGRDSGLHIGDILKVVGEKADVFDPVKGKLLGNVPGRVKGTVEIRGYLDNNGAMSVIHSGANFKVNDKVEVFR